MNNHRFSMQLMGALAVASLALFGGNVLRAQIPVTSSGAGPLTFDSLPPSTEWSFRSFSGGGTTYADAAAVDTTVQATAASTINSALTTDGGATPGTSANARWNSTLHVLQTRPTGNAGTMLMGQFVNNSGAIINDFDVSFSFQSYSPANGHLPGHEVYYSLSGNVNEWVKIPALSENETIGVHSVAMSSMNWQPGAVLYLLFFDDNADAITDPSYTLDDFAISFPGQPPVIVQEPLGQTNGEYSVTILSVAAGGTPPLSFQWQKNGTDIPGATSSTFVVTNTTGSGFAWGRPEDSGDYTVVVTGQANPPVTSQIAHVQISPDTNAPKFLWALVDTNTVRVLLSEPVINALDEYGNDNANLYWTVDEVGGPSVSPDRVALNGNEIALFFDSGLTIAADKSYTVTYSGIGALTDRAQTPNNSATPLTVSLSAHELVVVTMDQLWKYSDKDVAPPANWFTAGFDDSDTSFWSTGPGVLDAKRQSALPWCRTTLVNSLTNSIGTCLVLSNANATGDTPTYYFRTHFTFNGTPANTVLRLFGKFDDAAIVYLNGVEIERVGVPAGTFPHNIFVSGLRSVGDGDAPDTSVVIPGSALVNGDNVLAVELRQVNSTSSDITMALQVSAASSTSLAGVPPLITSQPVGVTNNEYTVNSLTVSASGTPPLSYQWRKNGSDIPGATSSTLVLSNTAGSGFAWSRPEDSGDYSVVVTGQANPPATSQTAHVQILPDATAPRAVWAVVDTNTVRVLLSEALTNDLADYATLAASLNWSVDKVSGPGASPGTPDLDVYLTNNEIHLVYSSLIIDPGTVYAVHYTGNTLYDRAQAGNGASTLSVPLSAHEQVVVAMDKLWKYSDKDVAPPANWFATSFDDSDPSFWLTGPGAFDAKREATEPWCRTTLVNSLTNSVGTCLVLSNANATGDTPTYYFRTHFNFAAATPGDALLKLYGKFDDAAVVYLNGVEIERVGVPEGAHPHGFIGGLRSVGDGDAPDTAVLVPGSLLVNGDNVIAVELRQINATSSDVTMALQVIAATAEPGAQQPRLTITTSSGQVSVSWAPVGGSLLEASAVTGPWTTNGAAANPHVFTPAPGAGQKFFKVAQ